MRTDSTIVLLVDDDQEYLKSASEAFLASGCGVMVASTAKEALGIVYENYKSQFVVFIDTKISFSAIVMCMRQLMHRVVICALVRNCTLPLKILEFKPGVREVYDKSTSFDELIMYFKKPAQDLLADLQVSRKDELTGLDHLGSFSDSVSAELETAKTRFQHQTFSLLLIDIDHFKAVNDTYGYEVGNDAIKVIARVIREQIRPADHPCRLGGDEFVVWLSDVDQETAFWIGQKLALAVASTPIEIKNAEPMFCTISVGVGELRRDEIDADALSELMRRADLGPFGLKSVRKGRQKRIA